MFSFHTHPGKVSTIHNKLLLQKYKSTNSKIINNIKGQGSPHHRIQPMDAAAMICLGSGDGVDDLSNYRMECFQKAQGRES